MSNELSTLTALPDVHLTSRVTPEWIMDPANEDTLYQTMRILGSTTLWGEEMDHDTVTRVYDFSRKINLGGRIPRHAVMFSPYHNYPGNVHRWPSNISPDHRGEFFQAEVLMLITKLMLLVQIFGTNLNWIQFFFLDHEVFRMKNKGVTTEFDQHNADIVELYDIYYGIIKGLVPHARIFLYGRGVSGQRLNGKELGDGTSVPCYNPQDHLAHIKRITEFVRKPYYGFPLSLWLGHGGGKENGTGVWTPRDYPLESDYDTGRVMASSLKKIFPIFYPCPWDTTIANRPVERLVEYVRGYHAGWIST